jgi:hypothetical protein|tara:strand:- start:189 stop:380 length:192 start_codon:yes stop_codon:yes gene_type:complete
MVAKGIKKYSTPTKDAVKVQQSIFANQNAYQNDHQTFESPNLANLVITGPGNKKIPQTDKIPT